MSLYGGIKFAASSSSSSGEIDKSSKEPTSTTNPSGSSSTAAAQPAPSASTSNSDIKKPGEWSAALKFAPRVNKPRPQPSSRPAGFGNGNTTSTSQNASGSGSNSPNVSESHKNAPDIIRSAEPTLNVNVNVNVPAGGVGVGLVGSNSKDEDEVQFGPDGLPLAKAPAMTLAATSKALPGMGKRGREGDEKKKKKKKKKKNNFGQPYISNFDPDEQYDPNRPNDLGEYQAYRKRLREEKRLKLVEERKRKAQGLSSDESSYYTDSEDEAPRRDAPKMFAPPKIYSESAQPQQQSYPPAPLQAGFRPPSSLTTSTPSAISGDDAYARRAALSHQNTPAATAPASGEDAYARRLAMSQQAATASSGDDAYARGVAMSQGQGNVSLPPSFAAAPPTFAVPGSAPPPPPPHASAIAPPPPASDIPGFGAFPSGPSAPLPIAESVEEQKDPADFAKMLEDRKKAAEAIAAKFKALAGGGPGIPGSSAPAATPAAAVSQPEEDSGSGTFAEKMMRKWGHQEGSTLGIRNEGLLHALSAEHVTSQPQLKPGEQLSKRQLAKQKIAQANLKNKKWVQNSNSRGRIVNANEDSRLMNERERKGEESRIICLVGVVDSVEDIDEELSDEIGEECSKYGIVERVVLHIVEPPPQDPGEILRIFVVFSGMAGAWRATKELDGRFFGGRKIVSAFDPSIIHPRSREGGES
uniref:Splicing factor 45 n=1 Tax=Kwoniella dejecticola CBS 10117 TaxID=1296121 RepID=A0A1A6A5J1_9TREE|nr:uncharacterized protein I303_04659 [Kwoniella dejecticola CBS 10117]OBR85324.1 hypothetical protein I303_04659 [Kwoniella dejecticola CBS 10117]